MLSARQFIVLVIAFVSALASPTCGQVTGIGVAGKGGSNIQVRVVYTNDRPVDEHLRVDLLTTGGMIVSASLTNSNGMASFYDVPGGDYRVRVTGATIQDTVNPSFFLDTRVRNYSETVIVQARAAQSSAVAAGPSVAVVDLDVPKPARKAAEKGVEAFNEGKLDDARKQFEKAIEGYPQYASAYNFLGMTLIQQQENERAQQAFEKAIALNGRLADAYTNLAKIYFRQQKFALCESLLEKSVGAEPRNPEALTYLVQVELLGGKYQQASENARRVHDLPHKEYGIVHLMAARALRARNLRQEAMTEYKLFLEEAPGSTNSSLARQELAQLEKQKQDWRRLESK
jgi:Flp pilus assembly protein TadD